MILTTYTSYSAFQPSTTLSGSQFDYYAEICSNAIEIYLNRKLDLSDNVEHHWVDESNTIILDEYPVNYIYLITQGLGDFGNITLSNTNKPVQVNYDNTRVNLIYDLGSTINSFPVSGYSTVTDLFSALRLNMIAETSGTVTVNIPSTYASISPIYLTNINYTNAGNNAIFEFYGYDIDSQISYTKESDRIIHFNRMLNPGSNAIMVRYNSGYASTTDLPTAIVSVCNQLIRDIASADENYGTGLYAKEKLGNAEVTNWDYEHTINRSVPSIALLKYENILNRYKKYDIAYY